MKVLDDHNALDVLECVCVCVCVCARARARVRARGVHGFVFTANNA